MAFVRPAVRRLLPETLWLGAQGARLRARHLPMRLNPAGRRARMRLSALRNAHRGQTCVILGNGPSLRELEPERLDGLPTFCLNRGYLWWQGSGRQPTFFVAVNELVIEQFHTEIAELSCPLFLPWIHREHFQDLDNIVFFEVRNDQRFITDARSGLAPCGTVTLVALQLAFHMGFSSSILLGVDHRFQSDVSPHAVVHQEGADRNHFRDDYFGPGTDWHLPALSQSERGYAQAREAYEAAGRTITNATPGTALEVFDRAELDQLLASAAKGEPALS